MKMLHVIPVLLHEIFIFRNFFVILGILSQYHVLKLIIFLIMLFMIAQFIGWI